LKKLIYSTLKKAEYSHKKITKKKRDRKLRKQLPKYDLKFTTTSKIAKISFVFITLVVASCICETSNPKVDKQYIPKSKLFGRTSTSITSTDKILEINRGGG
jgi:hypothetical protein